MDYLKIANSFPMWIAAALAIALVIFQTVIFMKKSYKTGLEMGLQETQMKSAMKSSLITSIGPSLIILTGLLSLLVTIGGPMSWMRMSFIGSLMFNLMAVGMGTEAVGVSMGIDPMTNIAFATAMWTMILGSIGWILVSVLTADKMDNFQEKISKGDDKLLTIISTSAMLGSFASLSSGHLIALNENTVAVIAGGLIMALVTYLSENKGMVKLKEWSLASALFGGMLVAVAFKYFM